MIEWEHDWYLVAGVTDDRPTDPLGQMIVWVLDPITGIRYVKLIPASEYNPEIHERLQL